MSFGIGRDFAGALAPQIDGKLRPYLRQALCSVVAVGSGAETGQVRVRLPGEDVLTADLPWAPVYGAVPIVNDVVRTLWDHASRFVVTTSAGGGGSAPRAFRTIGSGNGTLLTGVDAKLKFTTPEFITIGSWDDTNERWTPGEAGKFIIGGYAQLTSATVDVDCNMQIFLYRNGAEELPLGAAQSATNRNLGAAGAVSVTVTTITDYFELWAVYNGGSADISNANTFFWAWG